MKYKKVFNKYAQMILYMLCMLSGYIMAYIVSYIWSFKQWKCSAIVGTLILLIVWKVTYVFFCWIWTKRNKDTGVIECDMELSYGEIQWCNSISISGMFVIGVILLAQTGEEDYFEVISMALSIWMGSYISIQKVQQKNTIKEVVSYWEKEFKVNSKMVPICGTIFMCILVFIVALNYFQKVRLIFNEITIGFGIGGLLFVFGVVIKIKLLSFKNKITK